MSDYLILMGSALLFVACFGLWRFDDLFLKMHSATKAGTLGAGLILLGVSFQIKDFHSYTEIVLLILFIAITNPISANLIGRVAYGKDHQ